MMQFWKSHLLFPRHHWRFRVVQLGVIVTFLCVPLWYRFRDVPLFFPADLSVSHFLILLPLTYTIFAWLLMGLPGFAAFRQNTLWSWWAILFLSLLLWCYGSGGWAFMSVLRPYVATNAFLQFALVGLFALVVACVGPAPRIVILTLTFGLIWNSIIGGWQVAVQHSIGLRALGEFPISATGGSIIQAGELRWLRPYGLLSHPNVFAGVLVVMLLALVYWLTTERGRVWLLTLPIFIAGIWVLLLTFSRASYLGFVAGGFALFPLLIRTKRTGVYLWLSLIVSLMTAVTFFVMYRPLVLSRVGLEDAAVETYSVVERDILAQTAASAIHQNPIFGVGIGNYPWWAAYTLFYEDSPLRGNYGHNLLLSVWTELGIIGLLLFVLTMLTGVESVIQRIRANEGDPVGRAVLLAGFVALSIVGLFDYHTYALPQMQTLWWGMLACAMYTPAQDSK